MEKDDTTKQQIPPPSEKPGEKVKKGSKDLWEGIAGFFKELTNLTTGMDREGTVISIRNNKRMKGANAWLLICSIMVASLGLDLNSPAVIIGAMLISPLMSPILGIGLAVGINDKEMLGTALRHFALAMAIAIITSYLYFFFSPFGNITEEIRARTAPTLLDVLVAFFGGLAGIISTTRKDQSNAIPGVAIATALMPPLCVTGFGLATQNWNYALYSFYLFFINATFVSIATYIIVRYLRFPLKEYASRREQILTRWMLILFSAVLVLPSAFLLRNVLQEVRQERSIQQFIDDHFDEAICEFSKELPTDSFRINIVPFSNLKDAQKEEYRRLLRKEYEVTNAVLHFPQNISEIEQKRQIDDTKSEMMQLVNLERQKNQELAQGMEQLRTQLDSLTGRPHLLEQIQREGPLLFPNLKQLDIYYPSIPSVQPTDSIRKTPLYPLVHFQWRGRQVPKEEQRLVRWIQNRLDLDSVVIAH